jgi:hypothetical protein
LQKWDLSFAEKTCVWMLSCFCTQIYDKETSRRREQNPSSTKKVLAEYSKNSSQKQDRKFLNSLDDIEKTMLQHASNQPSKLTQHANKIYILLSTSKKDTDG